jgi:Fe-S-cluster containining protein
MGGMDSGPDNNARLDHVGIGGKGWAVVCGIPLNIPAHTRCTNCGACCGVFPVSAADIHRIGAYIRGHAEVLNVVKQVKESELVCPFRDETKMRCAVYPVRPLICRMFGVVQLMQCRNGNSANIDGFKFRMEEPVAFSHMVDWEKVASEVTGGDV